MGKRNTSMKYQVKSCLDEIILIDKDQRDEIFERVTGENQSDTSKKDFKKIKVDSELKTKTGEPLKQKLSEKFIFSIRSAKDTLERCNHFVSWLKTNYPEVKKLRQINENHCIEFLTEKKDTCKERTLLSYKNALMKLSHSANVKFGNNAFYTERVRNFNIKQEGERNGDTKNARQVTKRFYTDEQIERILANVKGIYKNPILTMAYLGARVHELSYIRKEHITLESSDLVYTEKDGFVNKQNTVYIKGKNGKESYRIILPQYIDFFRSLKENTADGQRVFPQVPKDPKKVRTYIGKAIARSAKNSGVDVCYKNHELRKYHSSVAYHYYLSEGWNKNDAAEYVVQRHLSHGSGREDLKKVYLWGLESA
ncbi:hypothetical protein [Niallia sp. RD1]|uniref:hypothetical protein n=1 Tax=Niallia sp. RD1 TaxID=2962858 RepID=UPI0020C18C35|nr:hypothetical protein [Niallia sp. RD1]UTI42853.1 hypothetical protein NKG37_03675 [Niallia sp. RD1]